MKEIRNISNGAVNCSTKGVLSITYYPIVPYLVPLVPDPQSFIGSPKALSPLHDLWHALLYAADAKVFESDLPFLDDRKVYVLRI